MASPGELREEAEQLRMSRARLVAAADAERRAIEQALHDGAQQHLAAVSVTLQLVRQLVDSDPDRARELIDELGREVREALERLRALAWRVYPSLLVDRGLGDALHAALGESPVAARLAAGELGRYSSDVEAAAYFGVVGAVERVDGATVVTVRVWDGGEALLFEIVHDGDGPGGDLTDIGDRLAALGGELTTTADSTDTRIRGRIPLRR